MKVALSWGILMMWHGHAPRNYFNESVVKIQWVGRYFMNTFHADYRLLRWSLDHIFHSTDFGLVEMRNVYLI